MAGAVAEAAPKPEPKGTRAKFENEGLRFIEPSRGPPIEIRPLTVNSGRFSSALDGVCVCVCPGPDRERLRAPRFFDRRLLRPLRAGDAVLLAEAGALPFVAENEAEAVWPADHVTPKPTEPSETDVFPSRGRGSVWGSARKSDAPERAMVVPNESERLPLPGDLDLGRNTGLVRSVD